MTQHQPSYGPTYPAGSYRGRWQSDSWKDISSQEQKKIRPAQSPDTLSTCDQANDRPQMTIGRARSTAVAPGMGRTAPSSRIETSRARLIRPTDCRERAVTLQMDRGRCVPIKSIFELYSYAPADLSTFSVNSKISDCSVRLRRSWKAWFRTCEARASGSPC